MTLLNTKQEQNEEVQIQNYMYHSNPFFLNLEEGGDGSLIENQNQSFLEKLRFKAIPSYTCMEDSFSALQLYQLEENISKKVAKSNRPLQVVGQLLQVVGRPPQVVSQDKKWSAMVRDDQHTENKPGVGWSTRKMAQRPRRPVVISENWLAGRKVVSKEKN